MRTRCEKTLVENVPHMTQWKRKRRTMTSASFARVWLTSRQQKGKLFCVVFFHYLNWHNSKRVIVSTSRSTRPNLATWNVGDRLTSYGNCAGYRRKACFPTENHRFINLSPRNQKPHPRVELIGFSSPDFRGADHNRMREQFKNKNYL